MESLSDSPHLTPLSDELLQDVESFHVLRLVALRIMNDHMFVVFRGNPFVNIDSATAVMPDILEAVEWSEMDT